MSQSDTIQGLFPNARITSTFRTPAHNAAVGGVPNSDHLTGNAVDFVVPNMSTAEAAAKLKAAGVPARVILDEGNHVHWSLPHNGGAPMTSAGGFDGSSIFGGAQSAGSPAAAQDPAGFDGSAIFADPKAPPTRNGAPGPMNPPRLDPALGIPAGGFPQPGHGSAIDIQDAQGNVYYGDPSSAPAGTPQGNMPGAVPAAGPPPGAPRKDQGLGFLWGMKKPLDNAASALQHGIQALGVDTSGIDKYLGSADAVKAQDQAYLAQQAHQGVVPGGLGQLVGGLTSGGALQAATGFGPLASGALIGAVNSDAKSLAGVAGDAAVGGVAGKVGDKVVGGAARLIAPKVMPAVRQLLDQGVRLTPGQVVGGAFRRIEDGATSIPLIGDMIKGGQRQAMSDFNRAAVNRALAPLGQKLPMKVPAGHDAVDYADQALGDAYNTVLPRITAKADPKLQSDLAGMAPDIATLTTDRQAQLKGIIDQRVLARFKDGVMDGSTMKLVDEDLGRMGREYGRSLDPDQRAMAGVLRSVQASLREAVARQNPAEAPLLKAINEGYANLVRVERAAVQPADGVFTPAQLGQAVRQSDSSIRKRATARGAAMMQDLSKAGRDVLPPKVPDSGTPFRQLVNLLTLGGAGVAAHMNPVTALPLGILGGIYSKPGQAAIRGILGRDASAAEQKAAALLTHLKRPAQVAGASAAVGSRKSGPDN